MPILRAVIAERALEAADVRATVDFERAAARLANRSHLERHET